MNPKLYDPSVPFSEPVRFLTCPPSQKVCLLGDARNAVRVYLHWVHGVSLPCIGVGCPNCHLEVRPYGYAPAAVAQCGPTGKWAWNRVILAVPFCAFALLDAYPNKDVLTISRKGDTKSGRLQWVASCKRVDVLIGTFDVMPHLHRLWSKRVAKLYPTDQWRLFEPTTETPAA